MDIIIYKYFIIYLYFGYNSIKKKLQKYINEKWLYNKYKVNICISKWIVE